MKIQKNNRTGLKPVKTAKQRSARWIGILSMLVLTLLSSARAELPKHNVAAASLDVVQNDTGNTAASVTVTTPVAVNDFRVRTGSNRGDYNVQIGDDATDDVANGIIMTSVAQNGRDNGEGTGTNFVISNIEFNGASYTGLNTYYIPVFNLSPSSAASSEYNINVAAAYFPYTNWIGALVRIAGNINGGGGVTNNEIIGTAGVAFGQNFQYISNGKSTLSLASFGIDSRTDGVLLVTEGKNEGNYALSQVNVTNGTWNLFVHDKDANAASTEEDPIAFVFVPKANTTVVSGRFNGDASIAMFSGDSPAFTVANIGTGSYELKIPGRAPTNGVLIISAEGGTSINQDNIVSYEPNAAGDGWVIQSRDGPLNASAVAGLQSPPATDAVVSFVYVPGPTPGITAVPPNNLVTTESGGTANFTVRLDTPPTADVTVTVASSNTGEGVVSTSSLLFTTADWNNPQTVTITGQDDAISDGAVPYHISLTASSSDPAYNGLAAANVLVANADNESGVTVTPISGLITTEAGGTATFSVRLNKVPTAEVTIGLSSSSTNEGTISASSLMFTTNNWEQEQIVTVTGVDDFVDDGDVNYTIVSAPATSSDLTYNGYNSADVSVTNLDNDDAGLIVTPTSGLTVTEAGTTTNYTVVLETKPTADVVFNVVSSDTSEGTVSPSTLTFTPSDWNTPKVVTITGVDDLVDDGTIAYTITNSVSSSDPVYAAFAPIVVSATTLDTEATITLSGIDTIYGIGTPAVGVDGRASITDLYSPNYNGGTLTVTLTANGSADDRLEIRNVGNGAGQIGVTGNTVNYGGVAIGTFSGGTGTTPLVVTFNSAATPAAVEALIRVVTFRNVNASPSLDSRTVSFVLSDADGGVSSASKTVRVGLLRQTHFQEGADWGYGTYTGAVDIQIHQQLPDTAFPAGNVTNRMWINWPDTNTANASQLLLRFENIFGTGQGQVPSNAVIVSAELVFNVIDSGDASPLYRLLQPWDAETSTWNNVFGGDGIQPNGSDAPLASDSQLGLEDGSGATGFGLAGVSVRPDIMAWATNEVNYGWGLPGFFLRADGTGVSPCEDPNISNRPRLRVTWLPAGTAGTSFRQGVNGYTGEFDTRIRQSEPDVNFSTLDYAYSDAMVVGSTNNPEQVLIRFDNIIGSGVGQIPSNAKIHAAMLDLASIGNNAMGDGGRFFALLTPWEDTVSTWNSWVNGIDTNGVEAAAIPTTSAGYPVLTPEVQGGFHSFELTADVSAWANGSRTNYGWAILPWPGGGDGWGIGLAESATETVRPQLRVYYSISSDVVIQPITWTSTSVTIPFIGVAATTYSIQRASAVAGTYTTIGTVATGPDGRATFTDNSPLPTTGFYRISNP